VGFLDRLWKAISEVEFSDMPGSVADPEDARKRAQAIAPVVWLLGKTGAGKTAIVAALTGDQYAQVGEGFEPCTRTAGFYDVPPEGRCCGFSIRGDLERRATTPRRTLPGVRDSRTSCWSRCKWRIRFSIRCCVF
jgi:hypothetical protein